MTDRALVTLTDATFEDEVGSSSVPYLVDFFAHWCAPCHALAPVLEDFVRERTAGLRAGTLDIMESPAIAERFNVSSVPTLILFRHGEPVLRLFGSKTTRQLAAELSPFLGADGKAST